jgi:HPr kinase/phosphorylase
MTESVRLHGSCVDIGGQGVLILGGPGAGKSDLVLRLIDQPGAGLTGKLRAACLVADDQVAIHRDGDRLMASAPQALHGLLEVRGLGIVSVAAAGGVALVLAVRLVAAQDIERLPEEGRAPLRCLGVSLPLALVDPSQASAPARIRAALDHLGGP